MAPSLYFEKPGVKFTHTHTHMQTLPSRHFSDSDIFTYQKLFFSVNETEEIVFPSKNIILFWRKRKFNTIGRQEETAQPTLLAPLWSALSPCLHCHLLCFGLSGCNHLSIWASVIKFDSQLKMII